MEILELLSERKFASLKPVVADMNATDLAQIFEEIKKEIAIELDRLVGASEDK